MKKLLPLIVLLPVALIAGLFGWNYVKSSPQYSVYKMYKAVEAHDYETFTKYVDIDSLVSSLVDKALEETKQKQAQETKGSEWAQLGQSFAEGLIALMKPTLKEQIKEAIKKEIEQGNFKKDYKPANAFKAITQIKVQRDGKIAKITLTNEKKGTLSLRMRQKEGYWQIFDMDFDFSELKSVEEKTQENKPEEIIIEKQIGNEVVLATLKLKVNSAKEQQTISAQYGSAKEAKEETKFVVIDMDLTNITDAGFDFFPDDGFRLIDDQGRKFETYRDTIGNIENYLNVRKLSPSITERGVLVYEIPSDAGHYSLTVGKQGTNETYKIILK
ncbi:hypothetical protein COU95_00330 [Candidatus Shapirobacteria bacterium CG10_big_fil_rev_8_21_14_0_10_40_9]|uniref:DUF4352 domain-containing protein n=1 Tax=Candidatus Shapirobacteria bacterium CG10_big_fil_rev_8_21_14_0_10_40_9 TaxID=1974888 RepID=A0A2M8L4I1_9BACT|nr:MAG: hypothetical protein COU95_00330 [Candidatus Shapirobacteria bacterium CG10_big_fil_rev_8_21_14_0_10_40_9]